MATAVVEQSLVTLAEARAHLKIPAERPDDDGYLVSLINAVADFMEAYCGKKLKEQAVATSYFDGTGSSSMFLPDYPIKTGTAVVRADSARDFANVSDLVLFDGTNAASAEYSVDEETGELVRFDDDVWPKGHKTVRANYTAGYSLASAKGQRLRLANFAILAQQWGLRGRDPMLDSVSLGGITRSWKTVGGILAPRGIPVEAKEILDAERRWEFAA